MACNRRHSDEGGSARMTLRTLIDGGLQYLTNRRDTMTKKQRYPPVGGAKTKPGEHGNDVCGACGGEIVQVKDRDTKACWKCGKKVQ